VKELGSLASKGGSNTSQNQTVAGVINELAVGSLLPNTGVLAKAAERLQGVFGAAGNAARVKKILFRASMEPDFALLLSQAPTDTRVFNLADRLSTIAKDAGFFGATSATLEGARTQENQQRTGPARQTPSPIAETRGSVSSSSASAPKSLSEAARQQPGVKESRISSPDSLASSAEKQAGGSYQALDSLLNAIQHVESSGDTSAVSEKGAKGPYQLMDDTGLQYHKRLGIKEKYNPFDKDQSRQIAKAILTDYYQMFGNWDQAVLAYHSGPGNVQKGTIGPQGRAYVPLVLQALSRGQA
jgi:soluble lytic murein transglycosylase-like protein